MSHCFPSVMVYRSDTGSYVCQDTANCNFYFMCSCYIYARNKYAHLIGNISPLCQILDRHLECMHTYLHNMKLLASTMQQGVPTVTWHISFKNVCHIVNIAHAANMLHGHIDSILCIYQDLTNWKIYFTYNCKMCDKQTCPPN